MMKEVDRVSEELLQGIGRCHLSVKSLDICSNGVQ
jgi:hypothetical protein